MRIAVIPINFAKKSDRTVQRESVHHQYAESVNYIACSVTMVNVKAGTIGSLVGSALCVMVWVVCLWCCKDSSYYTQASLLLAVLTIIALVLSLVFGLIWLGKRSAAKSMPTTVPNTPPQIATYVPEVAPHPAWVADTKMQPLVLPTGIKDDAVPGCLAYPGYKIVWLAGQTEKQITHIDNIGMITGDLAGVTVGPFNLRSDVAADTSTDASRFAMAMVFRKSIDFAGYSLALDSLCTTYLPDPLPLSTRR